MSLATFLAISSLLLGAFAKETYHLKEPTSRSHPEATPYATYRIKWYDIIRMYMMLLATFKAWSFGQAQGPPQVACGVATTSRLLKIIGLFCKRALQKRLYFAKETCDYKEPTTCSHPIGSHDFATKISRSVINYKQIIMDSRSNMLGFTSQSVREQNNNI